MIGNALAFLAGVLWIETRPELDALSCALWPLLLAGFACAFACIFFRHAPARRIALRAAILTAAVLWAGWRAQMGLSARTFDLARFRDCEITGTVISIPEIAEDRIQFDFEPDAPRLAGVPERLRLSVYDTTMTLRAAERWRFALRLRPPHGFANPGGFDYEGQLFRERIGAIGYVRASARNIRVAAAGWRRPVLRIRAAIAERMRLVLGESAARGVAMGLAVGATQEIEPAQWRVFQATGITHLIAISGLHVTMIAALGMVLVRLLWRLPWQPLPRRCRADVAAAVGAVAAAAYALLAGFSVPTQRTLVMFLAALAALWLRRWQPPSHVLAFALMAVLIFDPHAALAAGFWLSFLCVAAILWAADTRRRGGGKFHFVREFFTVQGAVTVALLPATLMLFGGVSLVAPLVNIAAIPYFGFLLVPAILLSLALIPVAPAIGEAALRLAAWSFDRFWPLLEQASRIPGAFLHFQSPDFWLVMALAVTALVMVSPFPWRVRALGVVVLVPLFYAKPPRPEPGGLQVTVLDVGQGLSVFVRTREHALLYDTGPGFRNGRSAGELAVAPFLWSIGVGRLDRLVISHPDDDHAGGAPAVAAAVDVADLRFGGHAPDPGQVRSRSAQACKAGEAWSWDGVRFEFLHPRPGEHWDDNNGSCVLSIVSPGGSLLLVGDIERLAEDRLTAARRLPPADIVVLPHHGSRSSSTAAFVAATRARYAIVSAGFMNRWGFPDPAVVGRWCGAGAVVAGTAEWGAISLEIDPSRGVGPPRAFRLQHRRYWHAPAAAAGRSLCLL